MKKLMCSDDMVKLVGNIVYPVDSLYITTSSVSPKTLWGGEWTQLKDNAYLKIVSSNPGKTGGTSDQHKIPLTSIPPHHHNIRTNHSDGTVGYNQEGLNVGLFYGTVRTNRIWADNAGGGEAYYPWYVGVYVWKRTKLA